MLDGYIAAFERSDAGHLVNVLRADATLEATPFRDWQDGRANCIRLLASDVMGIPGDWHLIATRANGQPAAVAYHCDVDGARRARDLVVLAPTPSGVSRVVAFHDHAVVAMFGLPDTLAV